MVYVIRYTRIISIQIKMVRLSNPKKTLSRSLSFHMVDVYAIRTETGKLSDHISMVAYLRMTAWLLVMYRTMVQLWETSESRKLRTHVMTLVPSFHSPVFRRFLVVQECYSMYWAILIGRTVCHSFSTYCMVERFAAS